MFKKPSVVVFLLLFTFLSVNPVFAQTRINTDIQVNTNTAQNSTEGQELIKERLDKQQEIQQLRRTKQAEVRARIEAMEATREARLAEAKKKRIENLYSILSRRMLAASTRLQTLIDRIESRLAEIESSNPEADTESILTTIAEAEELVVDAQTDIESLNSVVDTILESDDPKTAFEEVREIIMGAKVKLVEAHRLLASVIGDIRGLRVGVDSSNTKEPDSTRAGEVGE